MVKRKFGKVSKSLKILCPCLSAKFSFAVYGFINSSSCSEQSYFGWNLLFLSKKCPGPKSFDTEIGPREKMGIVVINKTIFSTFSQLSCSNFKFKLFEKPFSHQNCLKD